MDYGLPSNVQRMKYHRMLSMSHIPLNYGVSSRNQDCWNLKTMLSETLRLCFTSNIDDGSFAAFGGMKDIDGLQRNHIQVPDYVIFTQIWNVRYRSQFKKLL